VLRAGPFVVRSTAPPSFASQAVVHHAKRRRTTGACSPLLAERLLGTRSGSDACPDLFLRSGHGVVIRLSSCDTISDLYVRSCQSKGREIIFADDGENALSGDRALDISLRFAGALNSLGAQQPGDVVAFLCLGSATHAVAWFGTVVGGRVACNLHIRGETVERIAEALDWVGAKVLVHDPDLSKIATEAIEATGRSIARVALSDGSPDTNSFYSVISQQQAIDYAANRPAPDALGAIALSSGSTGKPKGVMHSQYSLLESSKAGQNVLECVSPNDCLLVVMNPSFVAWQLFVLAGLGGKAKTFLLRRFEAETVLELIEQELITIVPLIPTMWRMLMDSSPEDYNLTSLRLASVGGESPSAALVERLRSLICVRIVGTYMASESGTASTIVVRTEDIIVHNKAGSTGLPTLGADMKIIDPDGDMDDEMPVGDIGEIAVSSQSLAMGYWREPDLTAKKFVRGWWRSGDLGHIDTDGYLWVDGRVDNVINTGGIKVHAEEVEAALGRHPQVQHCAVVGRVDSKFGQRIEAFIIASDPAPTAETLDRFLREEQRLSGHKVPKVFNFVSELPIGSTGKVNRRALR
jgi:acyl-coenzyme A synthetase/AMP-(fatty) acid ligase